MSTSILEIYPPLQKLNLSTTQLSFLKTHTFDGKTLDELIAEAEKHNMEQISDHPGYPGEPVSHAMMHDIRLKIQSIIPLIPSK